MPVRVFPTPSQEWYADELYEAYRTKAVCLRLRHKRYVWGFQIAGALIVLGL